MHPLADAVRQWLTRQGHTLLGQPQPASSVSLRCADTGTVLLATLTFAERRASVAVKQLPGDANIGCVETLCRVHRTLRARDPRLARAMPEFLGFDSEKQLLAMEFVPGATLRDLLWMALWLPGWREDACRRHLAGAADMLGTLHNFSAAELGVPYVPRRNGFFRDRLEALWTDRRLLPFIPAAFRDPEQLYALLPGDFFEQTEGNLTPMDAQPKNTLVSRDGLVRYIDLDYLGGNPAVSLAHYLVSLDRIGLRHPLGWRSTRIAGWKQSFINRYAQLQPKAVEQLVFFYPWSLLCTLRAQIVRHPRSCRFLISFYGWRLRKFLEGLLPWTAARGRTHARGLFASPLAEQV